MTNLQFNLTKTAEGVITAIMHGDREISKAHGFTLIYRETAKDETLEQTALGKLVRAEAIEKLGMTKAGTHTYLANSRRAAAGGDMYKHNKATNKKAREAAAVKRAETLAASVTDKEVEKTETPTETVVEELNRWRVENKDTKVLIQTFTTRTAAQKFNKESTENTRWFDGEKAA